MRQQGLGALHWFKKKWWVWKDYKLAESAKD
jgi:hypothetical protein